MRLRHALCLLHMWEGAHCPHLCAGWVSREPSHEVFVHGCLIASCSCSWCSLEETCLQGCSAEGGDSLGGVGRQIPKGEIFVGLRARPQTLTCRCVSADKAVSMEQGLCYRSAAGGVCSFPLSHRITQQICCCSRVGKGWGKNCEECPVPGSGETKKVLCSRGRA